MSPLSHPAHLLVEGKNDRHVVWALCKQYNVPENFSVEVPGSDVGGVDELIESIPVRLRIARLRALGIVLDADQNLHGRWMAVRRSIVDFGYEHVPEQPSSEGTIVSTEGRPRVGVWLMPNNELPGMLENFVAYLISDGDTLATKAQSVLDSIETENINRYIPTHRPKAFIHTWLAWQENPGQPMGTSITARVLSNENPATLLFINWLMRLFEV